MDLIKQSIAAVINLKYEIYKILYPNLVKNYLMRMKQKSENENNLSENKENILNLPQHEGSENEYEIKAPKSIYFIKLLKLLAPKQLYVNDEREWCVACP